MFVLMHDLSASAQFYAYTHIFQTTLSIHAGHELCTLHVKEMHENYYTTTPVVLDFNNIYCQQYGVIAM